MKTRLPLYAVLVVLGGALAAPAVAQTIPMHSGHLSHGAPQMRANGSGLYYPNRPKYHHHQGFAGYRDHNLRAPLANEAYEALAPF